MAESTSPNDDQTNGSQSDEAASDEQQYVLIVQRQDALERPETRREQQVTLAASPKLSVLSALCLARDTNPEASAAFEGDCLEGVCGACTMLINGRVALACSTLLGEAADKHGRVRLAPMKHFPLVRDLVVDRSRINRSLSTLPVAGARGPSQVLPAADITTTRAQEVARLDQCHHCGACLEACPQYGVHNDFVGALTLHEVHLRNRAINGEHGKQARIEAMMAPGGVQNCGKAQNCVEVCPAQLPLVDSIQAVARATSKHMLFSWLLR